MSQMQRIHVEYSGNVQGVGFRFAAERIALRSGITGFAKNLSNGNVEIVCEGQKQQLESFLRDVDRSMYGYISDFHVDWFPARGEFSSFDIKF